MCFLLEPSNRKLLLYDPSTNDLRDVGVDSCGIEVHKESLIRINREESFYGRSCVSISRLVVIIYVNMCFLKKYCNVKL